MLTYDILWKIDIALTKTRGKLYNYIKTVATFEKGNNVLVSNWFVNEIDLENREIDNVDDVVIAFKDEYNDNMELLDIQGISALVHFKIFFSGRIEENLWKAKTDGYMHAYIIDKHSNKYVHQNLTNYRRHFRG